MGGTPDMRWGSSRCLWRGGRPCPFCLGHDIEVPQTRSVPKPMNMQNLQNETEAKSADADTIDFF